MPEDRSTGSALSRAARGSLAAALVGVAVARLALGTGAWGLALDAAVAVVAGVGTVSAARRARPGRSRWAWNLETVSVGCWLLAPLA